MNIKKKLVCHNFSIFSDNLYNILRRLKPILQII